MVTQGFVGSIGLGVANKIKHTDMYFVLIGEFLVVANFLEWWLVPTTADHCEPIPDHGNKVHIKDVQHFNLNSKSLTLL